jgi:hypothetical protein
MDAMSIGQLRRLNRKCTATPAVCVALRMGQAGILQINVYAFKFGQVSINTQGFDSILAVFTEYTLSVNKT